jgi:hypothetical protein
MVSRVQVVLAVVAVVATGASAAVLLHEPAPPEPADRVPGDVDYVGHLDTAPMRSDENTTRATRFALRFQSAVDFYSGPDFHASYAFREAGPEGEVENVTYFGRSNSSYEARIVTADWDADILPRAVERAENVSLSRTQVHGEVAYLGDGYGVAALDERLFVVGNATAVRDALAVHAGETESLSGPLRQRFESTGGYVRFAFRFRPSTVPSYPFVGDSVQRVEFVDGAYRTNGSRLVATTNVTVEDADTAGSVAAILDAGLTFYEFESSNPELKVELRRIQVRQDGRVVRARYASEPENYPVLIRGLYRNQPEPSGDLDRRETLERPR